MNHRLFTIIALAFLITSPSAFADVTLPTIFSDNMILQQQTSNAIWGTAQPGEKVTVQASWGAKATTTTDLHGKWKLFLKTPAHNSDTPNNSLTIKANNTIKINDVAIGEVWLCAGQSNMGWAVFMTYESEETIAQANAPNLRIYRSDRAHWPTPRNDCPTGAWAKCTPDVAKYTSAVSYYFGKKLHDELNIPVGIIVQAYAGTPIEGWMPWEIQQHNEWSINRKAFYDDRPASRKVSEADALATYQKELTDYHAQMARGEKDGLGRPVKAPIITKPATLGHQYPANIFNGMIHPIRPFGIRGAIWYQGERNAKNNWTAAGFRSQLELMIGYYRSSWHKMSGGNVADDFPFFFTQLPVWGFEQTQPVEGDDAAWAVVRESMRRVATEYPNTGMAIAIDTGDKFALHPKNKKPLGLRHAYLALANVYNKNFVASGPLYSSQKINGNKITLSFDSIGSGLMPAKPTPLNAFAIAGADRKWHWANATLKNNKVIVSSPDVSNPVAVRYAWAMNPSQRNLLYNKEGIPASPFRTDDWPLFSKIEGQATTYNDPKKQTPDKYQPQDWPRPKMTQ